MMKKNAILTATATIVLGLTLHADAFAGAKYKTIKLTNNWTGVEGVEICVGSGSTEADCVPINFNAGNSADCAQEMVDQLTGYTDGNGNNPYAGTKRVGSKVTICHTSKRPRVKDSDGINWARNCVDPGFDPTLGAEVLISVDGFADGAGEVSLFAQDVILTIPTFAGESALEVAEALMDALDSQTPDDDETYAFGVVSTEPQDPTSAVYVMIEALGSLDVMGIEFDSTDPGIHLSQEDCSQPTAVRGASWGQIKSLYMGD